MPNFNLITILAPLTLLTACTLDPKNIGEPNPSDPETSSAPTTEPATEPATDTASDSGAADPGSNTSSATEPDTADDSDSGGPGPDTTWPNITEPADTDTDTEDAELCPDPDPATNAAFQVILAADWPDATPKFHDISRTCTIDAVTADAVKVTTELTCDDAGTPRSAVVEVAAAPEGPVDWSVGQSVQLDSKVDIDVELGSTFRLQMVLAADPDVLLVNGLDTWGDGVPNAGKLGPIDFKRSTLPACGDDGEGTGIYSMTYSLADDSVTIWSGNRDALPIDAVRAFAIDVKEAMSNGFHGFTRVLVRRVQP